MDSCGKILLTLLRNGLSASENDAVARFEPFTGPGEASADWNAVRRLAQAQGVQAIAWDGLQRMTDEGILPAEQQPDRMMQLSWIGDVSVVESLCRRQQRVLELLAGFYAGHDIRTLLLKGRGLAMCYPVPEHRSSSDIDIWLYGEQRRADELLRREKGVTVNEDKHHHTVFFVKGVMIENHYDLLNQHSHPSNRGLERVLRGLTDECVERAAIGAAEVVLPSPNFNALFLLRHTASHFAAERIVLRHVADWAMFVRRYGAEVDWNWLEEVAREYNMLRFLRCLHGMAQRLTTMPDDVYPQFEHDELESRVLNDILQPEFCMERPQRGFAGIVAYKFRRWWSHRWKHRMVYREGLTVTFLSQLYSHLLKPGTIMD